MQMAIRVILLTLVIAGLCSSVFAEEEMSVWDIADTKVTRQPPGAFPNLPGGVAKELEKRGCTIPQVFLGGNGNAIKGYFIRKGQEDWAVLCSINRVSSIMIFEDGEIKNIHEIEKSPDKDWLQTTGIKELPIGFSREISIESEDGMRYRIKESGALVDADSIHEGIEEFFVNKASEIHYFYNGEWLTFSGAD